VNGRELLGYRPDLIYPIVKENIFLTAEGEVTKIQKYFSETEGYFFNSMRYCFKNKEGYFLKTCPICFREFLTKRPDAKVCRMGACRKAMQRHPRKLVWRLEARRNEKGFRPSL
jgi:hypothetical protein